MPFVTQLRFEDISGQVRPDRARLIALVKANEAPLYARISGRAGGIRECVNRKVEWGTDTLTSIRTTINNGGAAYDETTTVITLTDGTVVRPGSILKTEASGGEVMYAVSRSGNDLTVTRGYGGTTAAAGSVANGVTLRVIGFAAGEGSGLPAAKMQAATLVDNLIQHFKTTIELTGRAAAVETDTEPEMERQINVKLEETLRDIEQAFLYGRYAAAGTDANGKRVTSMRGLLQAITTNVTTGVGGLTRIALNNWARSMFDNGGPAERLCLAGGTALQAVNTLFENKLQVLQNDSTFGLAVTRVVTPYGILNFMYEPAMRFDAAGSIVGVNEGVLVIRPLKGRGLQKIMHNKDGEGVDAKVESWQADLTLEYGAEQQHGRLEGITGAA